MRRPLRIVVAPDSFKESLSAEAAARAIARGLRKAAPDARIDLVPMADGGEGTLFALAGAVGGRIQSARVRGPLGRPVAARWGLIHGGRTGVVEMAEASGLPLVPLRSRNPLLTSSFGTGQLIRRALDAGCRKVLLTLGGVATNDGGAGFARALGYRFLDRDGKDIPEGAAGLERLERIDASQVHPRLRRAKFVAACDVKNPLCGPRGSAAVYGPQKGATKAMIPKIDRALCRLGEIVERDLGVRVIDRPGAGAAGGAGAGALAFLRAELKPGAEIVVRASGLERRVRKADLVVTGEGRIDRQTFCGKTLDGVTRVARKHSVPVLAVCGQVAGVERQARARGIVGLYSLMTGKRSYADCLRRAARRIEETSETALRDWIDRTRSGS